MGSSGASGSHGRRSESQRDNFLDWGVPFYEGILARCPNHIDVLQVLGHLYTKQGEIEKGLEADLRLSVLCPTDKIVHYNLACSHALTGHKAEALQALEQAVMLGFDDLEKINTDPDLNDLREEPRFKAIVSTITPSENAHED